MKNSLKPSPSAGILAPGLPSVLSYSAANLTFTGVRVLDYLDETVGTLGIPIATPLMSVTFTGFLERDVPEAEMDAGRRLTAVVLSLCQYIIPAVHILTDFLAESRAVERII